MLPPIIWNASYIITDTGAKGPNDAKDNESQKAYFTRKYMEIHAALRKKKGHPKVTLLLF